MAQPHSPLTGRALEIFNEVHARNGIWDAHDQGRFAHATGSPRNSNPWDDAIGRSHINCGDWYRGWDASSRDE